MMNKNILIIYQVHGNEPIGADVVSILQANEKLAKYYDCIIGNPEAVKKDVRYINEDLNRVGNKSLNIQSYESKRSKELIKIISNYKYVIDIHETKSSDDVMLIVSNWSTDRHNSLLFCPVEKVFFWPSSNIDTYPISNNCANGFEIEIGTKTTYNEKINQIYIVLQKTINNIIGNIIANNTREYFGVYEKISKLDIKKDDILENFREYHSLSKEIFYSLRFGEHMGNIGYKMKRIDKYVNSGILTKINISSQLKILIDENNTL